MSVSLGLTGWQYLKFVKFCLLVVVLALFTSRGWGQAKFQKTYSFPGISQLVFGVQTADGGYVMSGIDGSACRINIVKTDCNGVLQWSKIYEIPSGCGRPNCVRQTNDGGYILVGSTAPTTLIWAVKTDPVGNIQWSKTYAPGQGLYIEQTSDGGYIITGTGGLLKIDGSGNTQWAKNYFGGDGTAREVHQTSDGGYVLVGGTGYIFVTKTDGNGNVQWNKSFGDPGVELGHSCKQTNDGGYVISGQTSGFGASDYDLYLLRLDPSGNHLWSKKYGVTQSTEDGTEVYQTTDGGFLVSGWTDLMGPIVQISCAIKTDVDGNLQWSKAYGVNPHCYSFNSQQTSDGGYAIFVDHGSPSAELGFYFVKTDPNGNSGCNEYNITPNISVTPTITTDLSPSSSNVAVNAANVNLNVSTPNTVESTFCSDSCNTASICGIKWHDRNRNGVKDPGESGLSGWTITLDDGFMLFPVTTGAGGYYCFSNFLPGTYKVYEEFQAGWAQTSPPFPQYTINLLAGQIVQNIDFGNDDCDTTPPTLAACLAGNQDNFDQAGSEPALPSAALQSALSSCTLYPRFDTTGGIPPTPCGECFAHTISGCWGKNCLVVGASLSFSLYRGGCNSLADDLIEFWQTSGPGSPKVVWSMFIKNLPGGGGTWLPGQFGSFSLDLANLPPDANLVTNILPALQDGDLDVVIRENTAVDYLRLEAEVCCLCCPKGDMNGNGLAQLGADVVMLLNCVFVQTNCNCHADMNGDGNLTPADVVILLNCASGNSPCPPCP